MHVTALRIYPVKACRGIALDRAALGRRGLEHDRRWMIVDPEGVFVTQREAPSLARVAVAIEEDALVLSLPERGEVRVPLTPRSTHVSRARMRVRVWKSEVEAVDCGEPAAHWLGAWLQRPVRLVAMPDDVERQVSLEHALPGDIVGFADGFPLLLTTTASLDDLNARLASPVPMDRFRPNIIVDGTSPWEEDGWKRVHIGGVPLRVAKPCARCSVPTVDQGTGERTGAEPLATLATFRQRGHAVLFGQNLIPDAAGTLAVGDALGVAS
jgi:uncharacterized protein YcbX